VARHLDRYVAVHSEVAPTLQHAAYSSALQGLRRSVWRARQGDSRHAKPHLMRD